MKTILSIQMSSSFFSCDDTGFFHEDRFHEDLVYLLYVLTTMMSSYCAKLCVRINVQLFGFYIPTIIGSIMSFLLSGSGFRVFPLENGSTKFNVFESLAQGSTHRNRLVLEPCGSVRAPTRCHQAVRRSLA